MAEGGVDERGSVLDLLGFEERADDGQDSPEITGRGAVQHRLGRVRTARGPVCGNRIPDFHWSVCPAGVPQEGSRVRVPPCAEVTESLVIRDGRRRRRRFPGGTGFGDARLGRRRDGRSVLGREELCRARTAFRYVSSTCSSGGGGCPVTSCDSAARLQSFAAGLATGSGARSCTP